MRQNAVDSSVFCDWVTLRQEHPGGGVPVVNNGRVWAVDSDGVVEWTTDQVLEVEGSHDTKIRLRSDGFRVELSGNIGRFNRADNVFGYDFEETVRRANELVNLFSIPPFTRGELCFVYGCGRPEWTGAVVTRVDVTQNLCLWNPENAALFLRYLSGKQKGRVKVGVSPDGQSVMWGYGSKYANMIAYDKAAEMARHQKRGGLVSEVFEFVKSLGVIRLEAKFKTRFLRQRHCRYLGEVTMGKVAHLFREERNKVLVERVNVDSYNDIPKPYRATAKDWRDGLTLRDSMTRSTFSRHRCALRRYGLDIAVPCGVKAFPMKVVELEPMALVAPDWYRQKYA